MKTSLHVDESIIAEGLLKAKLKHQMKAMEKAKREAEEAKLIQEGL